MDSLGTVLNQSPYKNQMSSIWSAAFDGTECFISNGQRKGYKTKTSDITNVDAFSRVLNIRVREEIVSLTENWEASLKPSRVIICEAAYEAQKVHEEALIQRRREDINLFSIKDKNLRDTEVLKLRTKIASAVMFYIAKETYGLDI